MQLNVLFTGIKTLTFLLKKSFKNTFAYDVSLHTKIQVYKWLNFVFNWLTDFEIVSKDFFERLLQAYLQMHLTAVTCFEIVVY